MPSVDVQGLDVPRLDVPLPMLPVLHIDDLRNHGARLAELRLGPPMISLKHEWLSRYSSRVRRFFHVGQKSFLVWPILGFCERSGPG